MGTKIKDDPYVLYAISEAAAEIAASRLQLLDGISRLYDLADAGHPITFEDRALVRRNQIRCAWRAVDAVDEIFARSGGNAARKTQSACSGSGATPTSGCSTRSIAPAPSTTPRR